MKLHLIAASLVVASFGFGCSEDVPPRVVIPTGGDTHQQQGDNMQAGDTNQAGDTHQAGDTAVGGDFGPQESIVGTWVSPCIPAPYDLYMKVTHVYAASTYTFTYDVYQDNGCSALRHLTAVLTGGYTTGGPAAGLASANEIDYTVSTYDVTIFSEDFAAAADGLGEYDTWVVDDTRSVLGRTMGLGLPTLAATNTIYSIYDVDGTNLYIGFANDPALVEGDRDTTLESVALAKQ